MIGLFSRIGGICLQQSKKKITTKSQSCWEGKISWLFCQKTAIQLACKIVRKFSIHLLRYTVVHIVPFNSGKIHKNWLEGLCYLIQPLKTTSVKYSSKIFELFPTQLSVTNYHCQLFSCLNPVVRSNIHNWLVLDQVYSLESKSTKDKQASKSRFNFTRTRIYV